MRKSQQGWGAAPGTWEEAVLSWHEQIQTVFRNRKDNNTRVTTRSHPPQDPNSEPTLQQR